jgi:hypothetical protein
MNKFRKKSLKMKQKLMKNVAVVELQVRIGVLLRKSQEIVVADSAKL